MMSLLNWFTRKRPAEPATVPERSGRERVDTTASQKTRDRLQEKSAAPSGTHDAERKTERVARRELLYNVVRDTMIRAGVLAAHYKFKVLVADTHGHEYIIVMDLSNGDVGDHARLAEVEALMAQTAKLRHDLLITAVYWRVRAPVTAGLSPSPPPPATASAPAVAQLPVNTAPATPRSASGGFVASRRSNPAASAGFEDTQLMDLNENAALPGNPPHGNLR
jgi:hypothetical protein